MRILAAVGSLSLVVLTCTGCGRKEAPGPSAPTTGASPATSVAIPREAAAPVPPTIDSKDLPFRIISVNQEYSEARVNQSTAGPGLRIGDQSFAKGIGTHAPSHIEIQLPAGTKRLSGGCGLDAFAGMAGNVICRVEAGGKVLWDSGTVSGSKDVARFSVGVEGTTQLTLVVDPNGSKDSDHTDWVDLKTE